MSDCRQVNLSISAETDRLVFGKSDTSETQKGFYTNKRGQKLFTRYVIGKKELKFEISINQPVLGQSLLNPSKILANM
jgi:hypothetical protein